MNKSLTKLFLFTSLLLVPALCSAGWSVVLQAQGQPVDGLYRSSISIGEAEKSSSLPAPPQAPFFSCSIAILSDDWESRLSESFKTMDEYDVKEWILTVNPCGNACGFGEASTVVRWNPEKLGDGIFEIREGYSGNGNIVVADMKKTSSFSITGKNESYYYTIIKR